MGSARKPKVRKPDVQLTVRLPAELHDQVVAYARRNDSSVAQVIRRALRTVVDS